MKNFKFSNSQSVYAYHWILLKTIWQFQICLIRLIRENLVQSTAEEKEIEKK